MTKKLALFLGILLSLSSFQTQADDSGIYLKRNGGNKHRNNEDYRDKHNYPRQKGDNTQSNTVIDENAPDKEMVKAVNNRRRLNFVEGGGMVVVQLLPDDTSGLQHQKWVVRLSNGETMQAVYNSDMCERVPLKVGDTVAMGGQFIWTNQGALLHWLHYDPKRNRPDGYVELNGKVYCGDGQRR